MVRLDLDGKVIDTEAYLVLYLKGDGKEPALEGGGNPLKMASLVLSLKSKIAEMVK